METGALPSNSCGGWQLVCSRFDTLNCYSRNTRVFRLQGIPSPSFYTTIHKILYLVEKEGQPTSTCRHNTQNIILLREEGIGSYCQLPYTNTNIILYVERRVCPRHLPLHPAKYYALVEEKGHPVSIFLYYNTQNIILLAEE